MKKHNFYAGPSILSQYTIEETAKAIHDFAGTGLSILEVSHRSKEFQAVVDEAVALFKELLEIPKDITYFSSVAALRHSSIWFPSTCLRRRQHM